MSAEQNTLKDDKPSFWRMAIETWKSGGLSVRQFCKQEGLSEPSFYFWRRKLTGDSVQNDQDKSESSAFIEVAMPKNDHIAIELLLTSGNVLRISPGVDTATLTMILSVIRTAGLC